MEYCFIRRKSLRKLIVKDELSDIIERIGMDEYMRIKDTPRFKYILKGRVDRSWLKRVHRNRGTYFRDINSIWVNCEVLWNSHAVLSKHISCDGDKLVWRNDIPSNADDANKEFKRFTKEFTMTVSHEHIHNALHTYVDDTASIRYDNIYHRWIRDKGYFG